MPSSNTNLVTSPIQPPASLQTLTPDLILHLFTLLEHTEAYCEMACLGVTCRKFYPIFKTVHPTPISLCESPHFNMPDILDHSPLRQRELLLWELRKRNATCLSNLLKNWIGPRYRSNAKYFVFLSREIYGDGAVISEMESRWEERYDDWLNLGPFLYVEKLGARLELLPNPVGLGDEWYTIVEKLLREMDWEGIKEWGVKNRVSWANTGFIIDKVKKTHVWKRMREESTLDALEEGIEMMGL